MLVGQITHSPSDRAGIFKQHTHQFLKSRTLNFINHINSTLLLYYAYSIYLICLTSFHTFFFSSFVFQGTLFHICNFHKIIHLPAEIIHKPLPIGSTFTLTYNTCLACTIFLLTQLH